MVERSVDPLVAPPLGLDQPRLGDAPRHEVFSYAIHPDCDLGADRVFRDAKLLRDGAMRQTMELAQGKHLAAAFRQGAKGIGQKREFLIMVERFGCIGSSLYHERTIRFRYRLERDDSVAAAQIN